MSFFRRLFGLDSPSPGGDSPRQVSTPQEPQPEPEHQPPAEPEWPPEPQPESIQQHFLSELNSYILRVLNPLVHQHSATLLRKRKTLITQDSYGIARRERWDQELDYFLTQVVRFRDLSSAQVRTI